MLKSCVLVGLDWAKPMMLLLLHVTCSCIFHAYVPSFLYLLILIYIGSLSLSFFWLACSIAPKCKSTLSWNPLRSSTTSFSPSIDSTPTRVQCRVKKARTDFSENFSQHSIHSERQVILSDFSDTDLLTFIHSRDWESLCNILVTCPSVII